jgi:hypothetical protein
VRDRAVVHARLQLQLLAAAGDHPAALNLWQVVDRAGRG